MSFNNKASRLGLAGVLAIGFALCLAWTSVAQAQVRYSLSGNTRAQIGGGLPLPITFAAPPNGAVKIASDAYVFQTTGPDPKGMTFIATPNPNFLTTMRTIPVFLANKNVFQVRTSFNANGPANGGGPGGVATVMTTMGGSAISDLGTAMFFAGGRPGAQTVSWCPGYPIPTGAINPGCVAASLGTPIKARIRYQGTGVQFGGTSRARLSNGGNKGGASVVLRGTGSLAPCTHTKLGGAGTNCFGAFSPVILSDTLMTSMGATFMTPGMPAGGGPWGLTGMGTGMAAKIYPIKVTKAGNVTMVGATQMGSLMANNVTDWVAPFTTGMVTISAPNALGGGETFKLEGFDNRISGIGSISLVSGAVSKRSNSGDNSNRGWLNYNIGFLDGISVPSISNGGLVLLSLLMVAATAWMLRRAVATNS